MVKVFHFPAIPSSLYPRQASVVAMLKKYRKKQSRSILEKLKSIIFTDYYVQTSNNCTIPNIEICLSGNRKHRPCKFGTPLEKFP